MTASLVPPRRFPPAHTVCAICSAIYPARGVHTCTYETPEEGEPMPTIPTHKSVPSHHQEVRLECLRLAAETGMKADQIQVYAADWADFVLDANQKEN